MRLTNEERAALRRAVNAHPDLKKIAPDVHVSSLNKDGLLALATSLGIDPATMQVAAPVVTAPIHKAEVMGDSEEICIPAPDAIETAIDDELARIRGLLTTGGFAQLDGVLRDLVREAKKPAEIIYQVGNGTTAPAVPHARPIAKATWGKTFGIRGAMASREVTLWDAQDAPVIDQHYVWPDSLSAVLSQLARKRNVFLTGPKGAGKTTFAEQLAARLHRPLSVISCDGGLEAIELIGQNLPKDGGFAWQDGQLLQAIRRPGTIILVDEPSVARPSALFVLQHLLQFREIYIRETGEKIPCAPGVCFLAADNTNGTGNGARRGFTDTNRINAATLDRFGIMVAVEYLPADKEARVLVARTGCTPALADILVNAAGLTRTVAASGNLVMPIGLRQLLSWAELLTDGIAPQTALELAVLNKASEADVETLRQQCMLTINRQAIADALANTAAPAPAAPVIAGQFSPSDEE
jgi:cobaltochelatase CobS